MPATDTSGRPGTGAGFAFRTPSTPLGRWSLHLAAAFVVLFGVNTVFVGVFGTTRSAAMSAFSHAWLPYFGIGMMAIGFASGVAGILAIARQRERSVLTLLTSVPAAFVVVFVLGEFLFPH